MNIGNFKIPGILVKAVLIIMPVIFIVSTYASFNNTDVNFRTEFDMQIKNRTAFFDKMWKTISQQSQIAVKNDSSFKHNVALIMEGRKDAQGLFMKWITESNPNADFRAVQELYRDLSRSIESERNSFYERETTLSSIQREHSRFLRSFPNNVYNLFLGRKELVYNPITSDKTDEVMKSGKDNDVKVF
jgi:hypothetical protein